MHAYPVDVYLNETLDRDGRLAIFARIGESPRVRPGDTVRLAGRLTLAAPDPEAAAEQAFIAGNDDDGDAATAYRSWGVRSLSVGDVVAVHTADGVRAYGCDSVGWHPVDRTALILLPLADVPRP